MPNIKALAIIVSDMNIFKVLQNEDGHTLKLPHPRAAMFLNQLKVF